MSIALKSCVLNHISLNFWYTVFWAHTSEANAQKAAITQHVSPKLSSLSCLIALKQSNTHKFMLKKHISYKNSYVCEGKQLGKKSHVYTWRIVYGSFRVNPISLSYPFLFPYPFVLPLALVPRNRVVSARGVNIPLWNETPLGYGYVIVHRR